MSETRDIVERLEHEWCEGVVFSGVTASMLDLYHEAATLITSLRTENATLKAECGAWRAWCEWGIHVTAGENDDVDDTTARHWKDVEAARTATNQLCPEWAKENP